LGFVLVLIPLAIPYLQVQEESGRRQWSEVSMMLPRIESYFYAPTSFLWKGLLRFGDNLPMHWEHYAFFGLLPYLALCAFLYLFLFRRGTSQYSSGEAGMMFALVAVGIVTLYVSGLSVYRLVWLYLPGAGGIRAVTRISLVLIYPAAFLLGTMITRCLIIDPVKAGGAVMGGLWNSKTGVRFKGIAVHLLGLAILILVVLDQATKVDLLDKQESQQRIAVMRSKLEGAVGKPIWVCLQNNEPFYMQVLDVMLAGQELNANVINGYSGLMPKSYPDVMWGLKDNYCDGLRLWRRLHPRELAEAPIFELGATCTTDIGEDFLPTPGKGFGGIEMGDKIHAWANAQVTELKIPALPEFVRPAVLAFDVISREGRKLKISGPNMADQLLDLLPGQSSHVELELPDPQLEKVIKFETKKNGFKVNADSPRYYFDVSNMHLRQKGF
jgi:hypothetical protein